MKHRNVMTVLFLSIITLGIYDLYWLVQVKKELNAKTNEHVPSIWLLFAPMAIFVVGLIAYIAATAAAANNDTAAKLGGIIIILFYLLALLAIVPITFYWFFKFSKAVHKYTNGELSTAVTMLLVWLLRFIGLAVIQDKFNDMIQEGATPSGPAPAPATEQQVAADPVQPVPDPAVTPQQPVQAPEAQPQTSVSPEVAPAPTPSAPAAPEQGNDQNQQPPFQNPPTPNVG